MPRFLNYSLICICLLLAGNFRAAPLPADDDPVLTVNISDGGNASMSWTAFGTSGAYTVTVNDLTTGRQVTEFNTANTSTSVSGLASGHSFQFRVSRNDVVIEIVSAG